MKRALLLVGLVAFGALSAQPAWAASTTQVVQGQILRLVSVADWDAAGSLLPGEPVQWDVAVSADAPDPGTVTIGVSATGDAELVVDATLCMQPWAASGCPGGETVLRSDWSLPRDGAEVVLTRMADTETAHVRLSIALAAGDEGGRTDVLVHATGAGESVVIGEDGGLATTGMPPVVFWVLGGGSVLLLFGCLLLLARRRRPHDEEES
ncbi:hypothetical protein QFZ53_003445 [Microbacterium natoriense]|uniref:LPXTG cell wall anchor domain-containing protein n=1 Tax=Microbacterium natoriense TaxID=284570 RepID=A0AAW8F2I3_9MICO|nr:hypothetical protein [Microbacterium natoriense]MDQ0649249.1 hypothetical protein [Microbacterium natoriense]